MNLGNTVHQLKKKLNIIYNSEIPIKYVCTSKSLLTFVYTLELLVGGDYSPEIKIQCKG